MSLALLEKSRAFVYDIICSCYIRRGTAIAHFFIDNPTIEIGQRVLLSQEDSHHGAKVLRIKKNDLLTLSNQQCLFEGRVLENSPQVSCEVTALLPSTEPCHKITLYQGLPKGEKMEFLLQKGTEAGIHTFVPVAMERSITKLTPKDAEKKLLRWNKITQEAAKQAKRVYIPKVEKPIPLSGLFKRIQSHDLFLIPWENASQNSLNQIVQNNPLTKDIGILIGPEGGISQDEIALAQAHEALTITLGRRIFRTETAGLACAIALFALYGDMA